jgi:hypothetical protein
MTRAADVAHALGGRRSGNGYVARCPAHKDSNPSLSLADGKRGLLVKCHAGCEPRDVLVALCRRGLLNQAHADASAAAAGEPNEPRTRLSTGNIYYEQRQHEKASWLWSQRWPIIGTAADHYLRERGYQGRIPPTLAFLPPVKSNQHPAMVAAFGIPDEPEPGVLGVPRDVNSVHLTLLRADGSGKADVEHPKIIIGSPRAHPIVLAPPNDLLGLCITEGIEDALTAYHATGLGAWAAASAGRMPLLADTVPYYIEAVTIFAHSDKVGQDKALDLAAKLHRKGVEVFVEGITL